MNGQDRLAVAVDLGGTKLAAAVIDAAGKLQARCAEPVAKGEPRIVADQVVATAERVLRESGANWERIAGLGLIVPGIANSRDDTVWLPNLWGDRDVPLAAALRGRIPVPLTVECDRAGYVAGEHWLGVARGLSDVVFVAVGTGIGVGILSGGRLVRGAGGSAGAAGWCALQPEYQPQYAVTGCWETEAAGPALARLGGAADAQTVVAAAARGERVALDAVAHVARYLGLGIANLISVLNPEMVVLGGGLMQAGELFLEPIRREVRRWAQPRAALQARIELTALGADAGLLGAARLALGPELI